METTGGEGTQIHLGATNRFENGYGAAKAQHSSIFRMTLLPESYPHMISLLQGGLLKLQGQRQQPNSYRILRYSNNH